MIVMRRKITLAVMMLFALAIGFFALFGTALRDMLSPHVTVIRPRFYESEGVYINRAVPSDAVLTDTMSGETYIYIIGENDSSGELCAYAVKTAVAASDTLGSYTALRGVTESNRVIIGSDAEFSDGQRVVVNEVTE